MEYAGSCHCGAIRFAFESEPIIDGMRCNCSICRRKGAVMSSFTLPPEHLKIEDSDGLLSSYRFDDEVAGHYFCSRCGIFTFVSTRLNPGEFRVNLGCVDGVDGSTLPVTLFDGENL